MATEKQKHEWLLYGGMAGGGLLLFLFWPKSVPQRGGTPHTTKPQRTVTPNPGQANLDQAYLSARENAVQAFDQGVLGSQSLQEQQNATYNTNFTNKEIAFNTNQAMTTQSRIAAAAAQAIASTQATAQESVAQTQANAMQNIQSQQSQGSWFQNIFGFLGSIFPFLGFSGLSSGGAPPSGGDLIPPIAGPII